MRRVAEIVGRNKFVQGSHRHRSKYVIRAPIGCPLQHTRVRSNTTFG